VNQAVSGQTGLTTATIKIQGWLNGSRTSAGSGVLRLDDVVISGVVSSAVSITGGTTSVTPFTTTYGTPSASQSFAV
jgi:hypothetical protein